MKKRSLVQFSIDHPKLVMWLAGITTLLFLTQFPRIQTDTNPKNMLPPTSDVRVWNDVVDKTFGLYEDTIVVGIVNDAGVLNRDTLERIAAITDGIIRLNGVAAQDVKSLTTIDNVTAGAELIRVRPLATPLPTSDKDIEKLRQALFDSSLFVGRVISKDEKTTAIYVPLEKGANGKKVADEIRAVIETQTGSERFYIAGDPVARDTFGAEMFKLMGIFAPIAGGIMMLVFVLMFRSITMAMAMMAVAMISIIWTMGLVIGLGFPIHIMASMGPVFLMAIATDSVHIFNEFNFRCNETRDKRSAILATMEAVGGPVRYTALATAVGFGVLLFMEIVPVKVFGGLVVFGTLALRLLSFSFIPAFLTFLKPERRASVVSEENVSTAARVLGRLGALGANRPAAVVAGCLVLVGISLVGLARISVNNNLVGWFKPDSEVRTADRVLNERLGGTSLGYLVVAGPSPDFIKTPEALRFIEGLQRHLESLPVVGRTLSVADYVKRINRVVHDDQRRFETIPDDSTTVGQYLFLFGMAAKPADLNNVVDYPFQQANVWIQLKTWDAAAMEQVVEAAQAYRAREHLPIEVKPAGTAYFNLVWNHEVLGDMVKGFALALIAVFVILVVNFRSMKWALIGYAPLLLTILLIYGVVGFVGKDFDMPIAVLSCLSLGMAVDFSLHFIGRLRQRLASTGGDAPPSAARLRDALIWTAMRPGKGILRNAVLFAAAFSVMLFASLTPYITVGAFIVSMMLISATLTIVMLPALVTLMQKRLPLGVHTNAKPVEVHA